MIVTAWYGRTPPPFSKANLRPFARTAPSSDKGKPIYKGPTSVERSKKGEPVDYQLEIRHHHPTDWKSVITTPLNCGIPAFMASYWAGIWMPGTG